MTIFIKWVKSRNRRRLITQIEHVRKRFICIVWFTYATRMTLPVADKYIIHVYVFFSFDFNLYIG